MGARGFFYARPVRKLVEDCYWLAHFYHRDPDEFLDKTVSRLLRHIEHTNRLTEQMEAERSTDG